MQRHKMMVHLKLRPYTCDYCEKSFGSKRDMERHKKSQHFRIKEKVLMVERFSQEKKFRLALIKPI